jgi:hypothetical protein
MEKALELSKTFQNISRKDTLRHFLQIHSFLQKKNLKLGSSEIDILTIMLNLPEELRINVLSTKSKEYIFEEYKKEHKKALSLQNFKLQIFKLKKKNILIKGEYDIYEFHPKFKTLIQNLKGNLVIEIKFDINDN